MPHHRRLHTDNASGEGKNQTILYLAAWLVRRGLFDSVTLSQFRVGHSHGKPDQRFSEIRTALAQSALLENPDQFAEAIAQGVKPRENRTLKTHRLQATPRENRTLKTHRLQATPRENRTLKTHRLQATIGP